MASAEKIMVTVVWVEILLPVGRTEGLIFSLKPPRRLKANLCQFHPTRKTSELLFL